MTNIRVSSNPNDLRDKAHVVSSNGRSNYYEYSSRNIQIETKQSLNLKIPSAIYSEQCTPKSSRANYTFGKLLDYSMGIGGKQNLRSTCSDLFSELNSKRKTGFNWFK